MVVLYMYVAPSDSDSMNVLGHSPRDWKKAMNQNTVPTIFYTQNICHNVWKIVRTTLQCIVVLKLRGEGPES